MHTNVLDAGIVHFLNSFAHRSWAFDTCFLLLASNNLLKGALVTCLFWGSWMRSRQTDADRERHEILLFGIFACIAVVLSIRFITLSLPFRVRPLHNPALHFQLPYTVDPSTLANWSSFPSDHMVLYGCLAVTICLVDKRIGAVALAYTLLTGLARVYAGFHYPTDILAGVILGSAFAMLALIVPLRKITTGWAMRWGDRFPASFYAFLFFCAFGIAEAFGSTYLILLTLIQVCKSLLHGMSAG